MNKQLIIILVLTLIIAGCIKGSVKAEQDTSINETITEQNKTFQEEPLTIQEPVPKIRDWFFPWKDSFYDLRSFHVTYLHAKSSSLDELIENDGKMDKNVENGILKIWLDEGKVRIDRYEFNYEGKEDCNIHPDEFIDYNGKRYALIVRELYIMKKINIWRFDVISKGVTSGGIDVWRCDTRKTAGFLEESITKPSTVMEMAYNQYPNKYAAPHFYTNEDAYNTETQKVKAAFDEYAHFDGARYVRETNALKQTKEILGRTTIPFYSTKNVTYPIYEYELIDKELGLGLAGYLKSFTSKAGNEIVLEKEIPLYQVLEFGTDVDANVFEK